MIEGICRISAPRSSRQVRIGLYPRGAAKKVKAFLEGDQYTAVYVPVDHAVHFTMLDMQVAMMKEGKATVTRESNGTRRMPLPGYRCTTFFDAEDTKFFYYDEDRTKSIRIVLPAKLKIVSDDTRGSLIGARRAEIKEKSREDNFKEMPIYDKTWPDKAYDDLDPGIRFAVRVLHAAGFDTCQSCQGGEGHAYDHPTVEMESTGGDSEGFGALAALQAYGLPVADIAIRWPVRNGLPYERLWTITFRKTMEDRADEKPMFVYGYRAQG